VIHVAFVERCANITVTSDFFIVAGTVTLISAACPVLDHAIR